MENLIRVQAYQGLPLQYARQVAKDLQRNTNLPHFCCLDIVAGYLSMRDPLEIYGHLDPPDLYDCIMDGQLSHDFIAKAQRAWEDEQTPKDQRKAALSGLAKSVFKESWGDLLTTDTRLSSGGCHLITSGVDENNNAVFRTERITDELYSVYGHMHSFSDPLDLAAYHLSYEALHNGKPVTVGTIKYAIDRPRTTDACHWSAVSAMRTMAYAKELLPLMISTGYWPDIARGSSVARTSVLFWDWLGLKKEEAFSLATDRVLHTNTLDGFRGARSRGVPSFQGELLDAPTERNSPDFDTEWGRSFYLASRQDDNLYASVSSPASSWQIVAVMSQEKQKEAELLSRSERSLHLYLRRALVTMTELMWFNQKDFGLMPGENYWSGPFYDMYVISSC